ncbi:unnamed protein product [Protopolystoma xenopodis]|uniref:Uncharacterized protein n=1 Tax=Protopolystoma xenopodis TaxID=117903 RepID=A0A3S5C8D3_9PLAT|nr:unnamed protein product [Protopolystoma xenopodis]
MDLSLACPNLPGIRILSGHSGFPCSWQTRGCRLSGDPVSWQTEPLEGRRGIETSGNRCYRPIRPSRDVFRTKPGHPGLGPNLGLRLFCLSLVSVTRVRSCVFLPLIKAFLFAKSLLGKMELSVLQVSEFGRQIATCQ